MCPPFVTPKQTTGRIMQALCITQKEKKKDCYEQMHVHILARSKQRDDFC